MLQCDMGDSSTLEQDLCIADIAVHEQKETAD